MNVIKYLTILLFMILQSCSYTVTEKELLFPQKIVYGAENNRDFNDISIITNDSVQLSARFLQKKSAIANVLILHGNRGNIYTSPWTDIVGTLSELKVNILAVDYRGFGKSSGDISFTMLPNDAQTALNYIKQSEISKLPIIVYGLSLGTYPAISVAKDSCVAGLVIEGAISSTMDMVSITKSRNWYMKFIDINYDKTLEFNSVDLIKSVSKPVLIIHGEKDNLPIWMSEKIYQAAPDSSKVLYRVNSGKHCDTYRMDKEKYIKHFTDFIARITNR